MIKLKDYLLLENIPRYFRGYISNIEGTLNRTEKNIKQFIKDLAADDFKQESLELQKLYKDHIIEFKIKFDRLKKKMK
mgnify:FL=1